MLISQKLQTCLEMDSCWLIGIEFQFCEVRDRSRV